MLNLLNMIIMDLAQFEVG